jgi:hypothetical protein
MAPKKATVIFRIFPGGTLMVRRARALGTMNAPPIPVKALITQTEIKVVMNPVTSEKIVHQTPAARSTLLCP